MSTDTHEPKTDVAKTAPPAPLVIGKRGFEITNSSELGRVAQLIFSSSVKPAWANNATDILICLEKGMEVGLRPMQSLTNIAVINGRPSIWGEAAMAIVRRSGLLAGYKKEWSGEDKGFMCTVTVRRKGDDFDFVGTFTLQEAIDAKLYPGSDKSAWSKYKKDMLGYRAQSRCFKEAFPDVLMGLTFSEEMLDYAAIEAQFEVVNPGDTGEDDPQLTQIAQAVGKDAVKQLTQAQVDSIDIPADAGKSPAQVQQVKDVQEAQEAAKARPADVTPAEAAKAAATVKPAPAPSEQIECARCGLDFDSVDENGHCDECAKAVVALAGTGTPGEQLF